jgi:DNA-binding MarR family transcriptional regulator
LAETSVEEEPADAGAAADEVLGHFGSLIRYVAGWHVPVFLGQELTMSQAKALYVVSLEPGISMSGLASRMRVGQSAISGLVDRLVESGHLVRREDPSDRRQQLVTVTEEGSRALDRIREFRVETLRTLMAGLEPAELEALRQGIAALDREAHRLDDSPSHERSHERTPA